MDARPLVGLGAAGYVAGVLGVPAVLAAAWLGPTSGGLLGEALLAALAIGALAGLAAAVATRRVEPVRHAGVTLRLLAVPVAGAVLVVAGALAAPRAVLGPGLAAAVLAVLGLLALRSGAATHHARRLADANEPLAALPEVAGRMPVARQRALNAAAGLVWLALAAGALLEDASATLLGVPAWTVHGTLGVGFLLVALSGGRSLAVTDDGVLVETSLTARLFEWDEFAGYYRGDRFVLLRREPWTEDLAFDRDAVSADAFAVFDESLPEREHRAVPAGDRRRRDGDAAGDG